MATDAQLSQVRIYMACDDTKRLNIELTELHATLNKDDYETNLVPLLGEAIENRWYKSVECLLQSNVPLDVRHISAAAEKSSYQTLEVLLRYGWDINAPIDTNTPPALAFAFHDANLTKWFLDHGANPNQRCHQYTDRTPLSIAFERAPISIIKILLANGASLQAGQVMHYAAMRELDDRLSVLQFLIDSGLSLNEIMYQNCGDEYYFHMYSGIGTPLHYAAGRGLLDSVKLLVQNGAAPRIKDPSGQTAADWARRLHHTEVFSFLHDLDVGADTGDTYQFTDQPGRHFKIALLDDVVSENGFVLI